VEGRHDELASGRVRINGLWSTGRERTGWWTSCELTPSKSAGRSVREEGGLAGDRRHGVVSCMAENGRVCSDGRMEGNKGHKLVAE
jgi:hypothetical protein